MKTSIEASVNVYADIRDARTGRLVRRSRCHNLVVAAGLNLLRDIVYGDAATLSHGGVGTDATAPASDQVALGAQVLRDSISQRTKGDGSLTIKFVVGSQQANGSTLREVALFNAAIGGSMYARATPEEVAKTDAILVVYSWELSWAVAP